MRSCPKCGTRYSDELAYCPNDGSATILIPERGSQVDPLIGSTIDNRYRIEARIGEGGMGVVYRASHTVLKKALAIKVMRGEQAQDAEVVQRFVQEAQSSSAIGHPNIISISDFGTTGDGSVYFAMEYLEGETLGKAMEQGPLPNERALYIFAQMASALDAAHQRGIVHRDLKPDNVFLVNQGAERDFVKVLDFGIAKVKNAAAKITRTGMVFGTPHYMSPEQAAGQTVDHRSDIYSLGVMMYQVFVGQLPFDAESYMGVMTKHMYDDPVPPSRITPQLRGALEDIILMALEKKPEQRYQGMQALKEDLDRASRGEPVLAGNRVVATSDTMAMSPVASEPTGTRRAVNTAPAQTPTLPEIGSEVSIELPINKRPAWLVPAIVASVVGLGVALLLPKPSSESTVVPVASKAAAPSPVPAALPPTAAVPAPAVDGEKPRVQISVRPVEAQLFLNDKLVGTGQAALDRPLQGQARVVIRRAGYIETEVVLDTGSPDTIQVSLDREHRKSERPGSEPSARKPRDQPGPKPVDNKAVDNKAAPVKRASPARSNALTDMVDPWQ